MVTDINEKRISGLGYEIATIAEEIQANSDDRDLIIGLTVILYEKSENLVDVLLHTINPDDHWIDKQLQRVTLQKSTTHRSVQ